MFLYTLKRILYVTPVALGVRRNRPDLIPNFLRDKLHGGMAADVMAPAQE